jgi:hypothetical protein
VCAAWLLVAGPALAQVKNPFERSMFESQASKGKEKNFLLVMGGTFLLVGVLYIVRSYLRRRSASISLDDMADQDLTTVKRGFFGSFATMVSGKRSVRELALNRLVEMDPPSLNCSIVRTADGRDANEDAGRAVLFHVNGEMFLQDKSFFITTPDGIKAEDRALFSGEGEVMNLWFLHDRIPYTVNCEVRERIRFPAEMLRNMDPKIGVGYRLVPLTNVAKRDKRQTIRFSHKIGRGALRVYPQVLFDVYIEKTDFRFPTEGSIPPRLNAVKPVPYRKPREGEGDGADFSAERVVTAFKEAIRLNHSEDRVVYVSKPYMDERTNKRTLVDLGYSEVLGLGAQEASRTIHIKKPMKSRIKNRKDPHYLNEGDIIVLDYMSRSPLDGKNEYYEMPCQIIKGGIENITIRPRRAPRQEMNLFVELLDFSVNGLRFESSREFMGYVFGDGEQPATLEEQKEALESMGFIFTFYPKLRFTRDTEAYKPDLPLKFCILGKIARCEVEKEEDTAVTGRLKEFGVRYTYDPVEYSIDDFCWDRWQMIRPFKENHYFKEVHKSLNGLIAHLESQSKDFLEPRRPAAQAQAEEKVTV